MRSLSSPKTRWRQATSGMAVALLLGGCSGPSTQGAVVLSTSVSESGVLLARYRSSRCRTGTGAEAPPLRSSFALRRTLRGAWTLRESRFGFSDLKFYQSFFSDGVRRFQAIIKTSAGEPRLWQYDVPVKPTIELPAKLVVASGFASSATSQDQFVADSKTVVLRCVLIPSAIIDGWPRDRVSCPDRRARCTKPPSDSRLRYPRDGYSSL